MKKIIITGCNGQLGRAVNKVLGAKKEYSLVNTDVVQTDLADSALDITDVEAVLSFVEEVKPYAIINCAGYTNVNACETDIDNAYRINAVGPRNLSIGATKTGAKIVHISTDYVFPGDGNRPYVEFDATGPKSVYGESKLAGEVFVREFAEKYFLLRTAWLYGEGKNFVKTMLSLSEKYDEVTVVNDQFGSPTYALELAKAIACLLPTENYGIFHATCEGQCSWADFSREIFRLAGKKTRVKDVTTEEYDAKNPSSAPRPAYSVLDNFMLRLTTDFTFATWEEAIADYMKTL